jgi:hypothetical protein
MKKASYIDWPFFIETTQTSGDVELATNSSLVLIFNAMNKIAAYAVNTWTTGIFGIKFTPKAL